GTADYDPTASDLTSGLLVFDYTVASGDDGTDVSIGDVDLNGAKITDAGGFTPQGSDSGSLQTYTPTALQIGPAFVQQTFTGLPLNSEVSEGQTIQLYLGLTDSVTVTGAPTLTLSNGATATYDAQASNPSDGSLSYLAFDYTAGGQN